MEDQLTHTRRAFMGSLGGAIFAWLGLGRSVDHCGHARAPGPHPDPRPDVDASRVLAAHQVPTDLAPLYDGIRAIPHIADGIRCMCGCADLKGFRSLLTCFESNGMATSCIQCQTEGRMVVRLHAAGRTLDQIRGAVDARFG